MVMKLTGDKNFKIPKKTGVEGNKKDEKDESEEKDENEKVIGGKRKRGRTYGKKKS